MADKKEILDYLRNKQKAAEIESKVNGINLWVLLGAIALVLWSLLDSFGGKGRLDLEITLRALVFAGCFYFLGFAISGSVGARDEIRFYRSSVMRVEAAIIFIVIGLLLFAPPALALHHFGADGSTVIMLVFGLTFVFIGVEGIFNVLKPHSKKQEKFPRPTFDSSARSRNATNVIMAAVFCAALGYQLFLVREKVSALMPEQIKAVLLLVTLYLLILIALDRKKKISDIDWTYEMETDLVLGFVTPDQALRRIEHRALGPRLREVMDNFFDELDKRFSSFDAALQACSKQISLAQEIPEDYKIERASRMKSASLEPSQIVEKIDSDVKEFSAYLEKLKEKKISNERPEGAFLLQSLVERNKKYRALASEARRKLDDALSGFEVRSPVKVGGN